MQLRDGRQLGYAEYGDPDGLPVFYFHGSPSSRLDGQLAHTPALQRGIRLLAIDRPGFGLSDFKPGRTFLDWPDDVAEFMDQVGVEVTSILAISGGAPHALACSVRMPERIRDLCLVNGFVPGGIGIFQRNLSLYNRIVGAVLPHLAPWALRPIFRRVAQMAENDPQALLARVQNAVPTGDRSVLGMPEIAETLFDTAHEAFRGGVDGAVWEARMLAGDWGFEPSQVLGHVFLFHGERNTIVPADAARELAQELPKCTARFLPDHAHILSPRIYADGLVALSDSARSPRSLS